MVINRSRKSGFQYAAYVSCAAIFTFISLTGCSVEQRDEIKYKAENTTKFDRQLDMSMDDYRRAMAPRPLASDELSGMEGVPDLAPVIAQEKTTVLPQPLVSISVNQTVPLRDILFELAEQADVDLELDPDITGSIIFTARERPFDQVVKRITDMAGLRYHFEDNVLRVELDEPYIKTYKVDYLNMARNNESGIQSSVSVLSGEGADTGSSNNLATTSSSDLWAELEANITQILQSTSNERGLVKSTRVTALPDAIPAVTTAELLENPSGEVEINTEGQVFEEDVPEGDDQAEAGQAASTQYALNKQAGLLSVFGTQKQHKYVSDYLDDMQASVSSQVLIEAKVLEVTLTDEFSAGINWSAVFDDISIETDFRRPSFVDVSSGEASIAISGSDFSVIADLVSRYGNVHTLSSPRTTVMNNQTSILNVAENRVFFELEIEQTQSGGLSSFLQTTIESEIRNVPEGFILSVHPSIDRKTQDVTLNLRPTITRIIDQVLDPAAAFLGRDNNIPVVAVRELDSIVKMKSGQTIVMGGLMQDSSQSTQTGIPVLSEIPVLGALFRNQVDGIEKSEMVILLRATIVENAQPDATDRMMYRKFGGDRHPLPL